MNKKIITGIGVAGISLIVTVSVAFASQAVSATQLDLTQKSGNERSSFVRTLAAETDETEVTLKEKPEARTLIGKNHMSIGKDSLSTLVEAGVITQAKADAIQVYMDTMMATAKEKAETEKTKTADMTEEERKAYLEEKKAERTQKAAENEADGTTASKPERKDIYSDLVSAGVITQADADSISAYYQEQSTKNVTDMIDSSMDRYVSESIIDRSTADKAVEYLKSNLVEKGTAKVTEKTDAEKSTEDKTSTRSSGKTGGMNSHQSLVDAGIITEAQMTKMNESDKAYMEVKMEEFRQANPDLPDRSDLPERSDLSEKGTKDLTGSSSKRAPNGELKEAPDMDSVKATVDA